MLAADVLIFLVPGSQTEFGNQDDGVFPLYPRKGGVAVNG